MTNKETETLEKREWEIAGGTNKNGDLFIWPKDKSGECSRHAIARIYGDWPNCEATTRLIAAAPELLEACETAYHELRIRCGYKPGAAAYDLLAQVIENAIGSQPWLHKVPGDKP